LFQGPKGDKGAAARAGAVVVADSNGLPTGFIEGPPGPPGSDGLAGKKVCVNLVQLELGYLVPTFIIDML